MKIEKNILLDEYFSKALETLKDMIRIPSFRKNPSLGLPVPEEIKKCLKFAINICEEWGLKTFIAPDYRYGYADWGKGDKLFGILCHLDVVPPGDLNKWKKSPFEPIIENGNLYGRGSLDDKGPTIMNMYAIKYLMDQGFEPDFKVRLIFGTSEETTWECMKAYTEREQLVDAGYVPDAEFPLVYAEKWILSGNLKGKFNSEFTLKGGEAYNVVCDRVEYSGPKIDKIEEYLALHKIKTERKDDLLVIFGQSAHGSLPELGINAITWALTAINEVGIEHPLAKFVTEFVHNQHDMKKLFGDLTDETGSLTTCIGMVEIKKDEFDLSFNFRIPCTRNVEQDVLNVISSYAAKDLNCEFAVDSKEKSVYFAKDSELVTKLMKVYQDVTGDLKSQPVAMGGGTFAKSMPNILAFGGMFGDSNLSMHANNEYVIIDELKSMLEIYANAILVLTKFD